VTPISASPAHANVTSGLHLGHIRPYLATFSLIQLHLVRLRGFKRPCIGACGRLEAPLPVSLVRYIEHLSGLCYFLAILADSGGCRLAFLPSHAVQSAYLSRKQCYLRHFRVVYGRKVKKYRRISGDG